MYLKKASVSLIAQKPILNIFPSYESYEPTKHDSTTQINENTDLKLNFSIRNENELALTMRVRNGGWERLR